MIFSRGEFFMKRICIALLFLLLISVCSLIASPIYKSFTVNGETVSRWVIESFVFEYDEQGNNTYYKTSSGFECWYEYDTDGNMIYCKYSDGGEEWHEYDAYGNMIYSKYSRGNEEWYEYEFYPSGKVSKKIEYRRF